MKMLRFPAAIALLALLVTAAVHVDAASNARGLDAQIPRYQHIFVIVEENKDYGEIIGSSDAPTITRLAREYGNATDFYAETHPSEPNYVALIGGYTYGIRDDDAYFCKPHSSSPLCPDSNEPGYVNHTVNAPNLATQLQAAHLSWKNYNESLPKPGSLAVIAADPHARDVPSTLEVYASKHSGFINFVSVQKDPRRAQHIVGFDQLYSDLKSGNVPNLSFIIPNLCNEMHGAGEPGTPEDCQYSHLGKLIWRGDQNVASITQRIMASPVWRSSANAAIVITFDEDGHFPTLDYTGCCGNDPHDPANRGGGHIPTVVITNHGPRHVSDATPYSHYSLLRTIEDAFGIHTYLRQAGAAGVKPMLPLFRLR
ncbi:MAG TPA: alkaline phosphatase family protein [Candidatus Tyrphobacter sp.]